ncbi:MAG: hypothetical protein EBU18_12310, partial [Rhodobacteraceae bacterium]|nr:hypothetical protein [Paracoccaceae bacterium]
TIKKDAAKTNDIKTELANVKPKTPPFAQMRGGAFFCTVILTVLTECLRYSAATRTPRERLDRPSVYDTASLTLGTGLV